ncbi:hypothetical protein Bca52824_039632 [Brassica carinata]|uniref:DUF4283 domain-containing protein n=1 Tax=Brassica carinata TaxID=52824 RepID=A0A8X7RRZ8_BRACI|nr:hypothetical protein Bca52824_039632 [Brassica carinata]
MKEGESARKRLKITVPHFDNSALIKTYSKTLIGRCMNPPEQDMKALIQNVPKIWKLEDRVIGTDLGFGKFQFDFETENDIDAVMKLQPYHFEYWMLALARWQPKKNQLFPSEITFWVRVIGVPMEFRTTPTFESLGEALGRLVAVDVEHCRVQVVVDAFQELCFETTLDFKGGEFYDGEEVKTSLRYEKLFGYCDVCSSLCHKEELCPLSKKTVATASPEKRRKDREGNGGWYDGGKHDDRARSYNGVVINGAPKQQYKERDGRDYHGKGKGKMTDEADLKWVKAADRGNKGSSNGHKGYRGDGEGSRYKSSRRDETKVDTQEGHGRTLSGHTGAQQVHGTVRSEAKEDGEIRDPVVIDKILPSQEFHEQLVKTQTLGTEAISDLMEVEKGLQMIQGLVEKQPVLEDDKVMNMDEFRAVFLEHGIDLDAADSLPDVSDSELEEMMKEQEEGDNTQRELEIGTNAEKKEQVDEVTGKKHASRKRLLKASLGTAVSTKMRIASALASPRKRAPTKIGTRHGDNVKQ